MGSKDFPISAFLQKKEDFSLRNQNFVRIEECDDRAASSFLRY